jgi:hypothetical protein
MCRGLSRFLYLLGMDEERAASYEIAREFSPEPSEPAFEVADIFRRYGRA